MKASFAKHSRKLHPKQAEREARKALNRQLKPEEIERTYILPDGREVVVLKAQPQIPGYTYSF